MGKKTKKQLSSMARNRRRTARELRAARESGYDVLKDINRLIGSQLGRETRRTGRTLDAANRRTLERMSLLVGNLEAAGRRTAGGTEARYERDSEAMVNDFQRRSSTTLRRGVNTGTAQAQAGKQYGKGVSRSAQDIIRIFEAGAAEMKAGGDYTAARALNERAQVDATLLAQMRHDEEMAKLNIAAQEEAAAKARKHEMALLDMQMRAEDSKARKTGNEETWQMLRNNLIQVSKLGATATQLFRKGENIPVGDTTLAEADLEDPEQRAAAVQALTETLIGHVPASLGDAGAIVAGQIARAVVERGGTPGKETLSEAVFGLDQAGAYRDYATKHATKVRNLLERTYTGALDGPLPTYVDPTPESGPGVDFTRWFRQAGNVNSVADAVDLVVPYGKEITQWGGDRVEDTGDWLFHSVPEWFGSFL